MTRKTKTIGQLIRRARLALDLTQVDLAFACGISQGAVSKIENDEQGMNLPDALIMVRVLQLNMVDVNMCFAAELRAAERRLKEVDKG